MHSKKEHTYLHVVVSYRLLPKWSSFVQPWSGQNYTVSSPRMKKAFIPQEPKTILYYTPFFRFKDYQFGFGQDAFVKHCSRMGQAATNCVATADRQYHGEGGLKAFDAVMFHMRNIREWTNSRFGESNNIAILKYLTF